MELAFSNYQEELRTRQNNLNDINEKLPQHFLEEMNDWSKENVEDILNKHLETYEIRRFLKSTFKLFSVWIYEGVHL